VHDVGGSGGDDNGSDKGDKSRSRGSGSGGNQGDDSGGSSSSRSGDDDGADDSFCHGTRDAGDDTRPSGEFVSWQTKRTTQRGTMLALRTFPRQGGFCPAYVLTVSEVDGEGASLAGDSMTRSPWAVASGDGYGVLSPNQSALAPSRNSLVASLA
jgi:hypothetical protein